jgi:SusD family.
MKKYLVYLSVIIASVLSFSGCYDLDQYPADTVTAGTFWKDDEDAVEGLMGIYNTMKKDEAFGVYYTRDCLSDIGIGLNWGVYGYIEESQGNSNASTGTYKSVWTRLYDGVARANTFLAHVKDVNIQAEVKQQYIAEAKFMRALFYNELLNLYGGVPIYDETTLIDVDFANMKEPRSSADKVRSFILADLDEAIEFLPKTRDSKSIGRASQGAAYALKGKVLLYNKQYKEAATAFEQVVNGGYGYSLNPDYAELFKPGGDESQEMIFAIQNMGGASTAYGMPVFYIGNRASYGSCINCLVPSVELVDMYDCKDGKPFRWEDFFEDYNSDPAIKDKIFKSKFDDKGKHVTEYPVYKDRLLAMYEQRDPRMKETIILPYTMYGGWVNNGPKDCEMVIADKNPSSEYNGYVRNAFGHNTYLYRKFVPEYNMDGLITDRFNSPTNFPLIRYADVLLMLAECDNELGNQPAAVSLINQVRDRAGVAALNSGPSFLAVNTKEEVFERLKKERAVEFAAEGVRYNDLKRWGLLVELTNGQAQQDVLGNTISTKSTSSKNNLWPIPYAEREMNGLLTQNEDW